MTLHDPWFLALVLVIPFVEMVRYLLRAALRATTPRVRIGNFATLAKTGTTWRARLEPLVAPALRCLAGAALALAIARPQEGRAETRIVSEGIDIMLTVDLSYSMRAEDMAVEEKGEERRANRLDAARRVISEFIDARETDRIGLVVFAGNSFTQCPLTLDYGIVKGFVKLLKCVEYGSPDDGTAIGEGLRTAVARLVDRPSKSKVAVLLTDGRNNRGELDPEKAAKLAEAAGVKVYAVGVGGQGAAPIPVPDGFGGTVYRRAAEDIDEDTLKKVAGITGGRYFRAADFEGLKNTYEEIDRLEKTKKETPKYLEYEERFGWPVALAAILVALEVILLGTAFRRIP